MTNISFDGVGARIAYYRKLENMSGDELAQRAGNGVTRAVLANIETGRKKDLSVVHLTAIAVALGVPPTALLFDLTKPRKPTSIPIGMIDPKAALRPMETWEAAGWFGGQLFGDVAMNDGGPESFIQGFYLPRQFAEYMLDRSILEKHKADVAVLEIKAAAGRIEPNEQNELLYLRSRVEAYEESNAELAAFLVEHGVDIEPWEA
jgi:transcriptional regulator with XRE-family HTH domain